MWVTWAIDIGNSGSKYNPVSCKTSDIVSLFENIFENYIILTTDLASNNL